MKILTILPGYSQLILTNKAINGKEVRSLPKWTVNGTRGQGSLLKETSRRKCLVEVSKIVQYHLGLWYSLQFLSKRVVLTQIAQDSIANTMIWNLAILVLHLSQHFYNV